MACQPESLSERKVRLRGGDRVPAPADSLREKRERRAGEPGGNRPRSASPKGSDPDRP